MTWHERDWSKLHSDCSTVINAIRGDWNSILADPATREIECLAFVKEHASLFFNQSTETPITVSEMSLGSDHRIDFMTATDGFSHGTKYTLYEFEPPSEPAFSKKGTKSARLAGAIDQISDWKRWLRYHQTMAKRILPSFQWEHGADPVWEFKVVIGRRGSAQRHRDRIDFLREETGIEVISFDRLSDRLQRAFFRTHFYTGLSSEGSEFDSDQALLNLAACPFLKSIPDQEWKEATKSYPGQFSSHLIPSYLRYLVSAGRVNASRLKAFDDCLAARRPSDGGI